MKNGCNFHALQVKSNYKIFSEKIEPKKDACRMAIKIKGKLPLKICSVLFVLYGAASLVALLLCLIDRKYVEEYDLSAYFNSSMPVLSVAGAMLVPVLLLIAGLMGHARADRPNSMKPCFFLGLATGVILAVRLAYASMRLSLRVASCSTLTAPGRSPSSASVLAVLSSVST